MEHNSIIKEIIEICSKHSFDLERGLEQNQALVNTVLALVNAIEIVEQFQNCSDEHLAEIAKEICEALQI